MPQYHVGFGIAGIYAGTQKKPGEWGAKTCVTDEAIKASAQYLLEHELSFTFNYRGNRYRMSVSPVETDVQKDETR